MKFAELNLDNLESSNLESTFMDMQELKKKWDLFGKTDPFSAVYKPGKNEKWQAEELFRLGEEEVRHLMEYIHKLGFILTRGKALDFGCGIGRLTQALAPYFDRVYGLDIAPSMIQLALKYNRYPDQCVYRINEQDHLHLFADDYFDFIYSNITLQHMEPRHARKYILEFLRVLEPHGLLIFQQPSEPRPLPPLSLRSLRWFLISLTPKFLLRLYYSRKGIRLEDVISARLRIPMYGIRKEDVVTLLEKGGGKILDIAENNSAGPNWVSFQYCVTKAGK